LLLHGVAVIAAAAGCTRSTPARPTPAAGVLPPEFERWNREANGILSDVLETLRTFDTFHAFRVSTAPNSGQRLPSELAWDPPTGAAWDEATHVTRGLHGRSEQLQLAVTSASLGSGVWREQRQLADATSELLDLANVLGAYRRQVDELPPGDAGRALPLLERAWSQFETAAARWGKGRSEMIACA